MMIINYERPLDDMQQYVQLYMTRVSISSSSVAISLYICVYVLLLVLPRQLGTTDLEACAIVHVQARAVEYIIRHRDYLVGKNK